MMENLLMLKQTTHWQYYCYINISSVSSYTRWCAPQSQGVVFEGLFVFGKLCFTNTLPGVLYSCLSAQPSCHSGTYIVFFISATVVICEPIMYMSYVHGRQITASEKVPQ